MDKKLKETRPGFAVKAILVIILTLLFRCVSARNHAVRGLSGWDSNSNIQVWAHSKTFHAGDNLVFKYGPERVVLEVNRADFRMCRTINPISTYIGGSTVVPLPEEGTRYFISGRSSHCAMGLRLRVHILALDVNPPANEDSSSASNGRTTSPRTGCSSGNEDCQDHGTRRLLLPRDKHIVVATPPPRFPHHVLHLCFGIMILLIIYSLVISRAQVWTSCEHCTALTFENEQSFFTHQREEHWHLKFRCRLCSHRFQTKESMMIHMSQIHDHVVNVATYVCAFHSKKFDSVNAIQNHNKMAHRTWSTECQTCYNRFPSEQSLAVHVAKGH